MCVCYRLLLLCLSHLLLLCQLQPYRRTCLSLALLCTSFLHRGSQQQDRTGSLRGEQPHPQHSTPIHSAMMLYHSLFIVPELAHSSARLITIHRLQWPDSPPSILSYTVSCIHWLTWNYCPCPRLIGLDWSGSEVSHSRGLGGLRASKNTTNTHDEAPLSINQSINLSIHRLYSSSI